MPPRTYVYVDGFNLYYGAIKGTPHKWLNIRRLCELLLPHHSIAKIKYFTARVSARKNDPHQPIRQQMFLRALRTVPDLEIVYGSFLSHDVTMPLAEPSPGGPRFAKVTRTEEKGSDVNIAAHLIRDDELHLQVGILNPQRRPSMDLSKHASFIKKIREGALRSSQFPETLKDANGEFHKPAAW